MPIDTREKRASAIHVSLPWRTSLPLPDGAISQADRQHTAFMYSGILAAAPVVTLTPDLDCAVHLAYLEPSHHLTYPESAHVPIPEPQHIMGLEAPHSMIYTTKKIHVRCS